MLITSRKNSLVSHYRLLCRDRRERESSGEFCIEGAKLCEEALDCGVVAVTLMVSESGREKYREIYEFTKQ